MEKELEHKIKELQLLEQSLNNILFQRQTFQLELNEVNTSVTELASSSGDVFKIVGNVMIKGEKEKLQKELEEKKEIIDLRMKNIEKQEKALRERVEELRKEVLSNMGEGKK